MKQFFQDDNNRYSMSRLLVFGAFCVSSPIVIYLHNVESLTIYLSAFVVNYGIGKVSETASKFSKNEVKNGTPD